MATSTSSRSSRLEPVGLRYVLVLIACIGERLARAREGSEYRLTRPISDDRSVPRRRSAARAKASAPTVSAADFPICCR